MKVVFGWLVPGGAYLLERRYKQFTLRFLLILTAFGAGIAAEGMSQPGQPGSVALLGTLVKMLAGGPYLVARLFTHSQLSISAPVHEYGSTLLIAAGLINLLVLAEGR